MKHRSDTRVLRLSHNLESQSCRRLTREEVPAPPIDSVEGRWESRSIVYDLGRQRWRLAKPPNAANKVLIYILYREKGDIKDGAFPWLELYRAPDCPF